jgi:hypothetical protein
MVSNFFSRENDYKPWQRSQANFFPRTDDDSNETAI